MAGYSGTPLAKKLGIKEGSRLLLIDAPEGFEFTLGLPAEVTVMRRILPPSFHVVVFFPASAADLTRRFSMMAGALRPDGGVWVAWPKKASGVPTDLTENVVREIGLAKGLVDNKVCAIDEVWSGVRFVYRLRDRPKPFR